MSCVSYKIGRLLRLRGAHFLACTGRCWSVSPPAHALISGEKHDSRASRRASAVASDRAPGGADASTSPPHIRLPRAHAGWGAMSHLSSRRTSVHVSRRAACPSPLQVFLWQRSPVHAPSRSLRLPIRSFPSLGHAPTTTTNGARRERPPLSPCPHARARELHATEELPAFAENRDANDTATCIAAAMILSCPPL